ncbi:MAG TPA: response regulator [Longimicrobiales bacterium]|nr:response regulator [Longimicrobiales bacterium]
MPRNVVVDDDPLFRSSLVRYLRRLGHDIVEADDGRGALSALSRGDVDLIVTDINMPEVDGIEVLTAVRSHAPDVPVIAMSGGGLLPKEILLTSAGMLGAVATLEKPFELEALERAVESALEGAA